MSRIISNPDQFRKNVGDKLSVIVKDDVIIESIKTRIAECREYYNELVINLK